MDAKEKAIELVKKYSDYLYKYDYKETAEVKAKECALIAVDEIHNYCIGKHYNKYSLAWLRLERVKDEINKL